VTLSVGYPVDDLHFDSAFYQDYCQGFSTVFCSYLGIGGPDIWTFLSFLNIAPMLTSADPSDVNIGQHYRPALASQILIRVPDSVKLAYPYSSRCFGPSP
jgi:hypothetical protein